MPLLEYEQLGVGPPQQRLARTYDQALGNRLKTVRNEAPFGAEVYYQFEHIVETFYPGQDQTENKQIRPCWAGLWLQTRAGRVGANP